VVSIVTVGITEGLTAQLLNFSGPGDLSPWARLFARARSVQKIVGGVNSKNSRSGPATDLP